MTEFSPAQAIAYRLLRFQELALGATSELSAEQLLSRPSASSPAIGFHLWHIARGTDYIQSEVGRLLSEGTPDSSQQLWHSDDIAARWGLASETLGTGETGMEMSEEVADSMKLPVKEELIGYTRSVFSALARALDKVEDHHLPTRLIDLYGRNTNLGAFLLNHLSHMDRHLGMIEALKGTLGLSGSATA